MAYPKGKSWPLPETKVCNVCGIEKPLSEFNFKQRKASRRPRHCCRECQRADGREYSKKNRATILVKSRARYYANKEKRCAQIKAYREKNLAHLKEMQLKWNKYRYRNDGDFRLRAILRARVLEAIKTGEGSKRGTTQELLGAPWQDVRKWIEAKFCEGMSWENHGAVWHIDHIVPCAAWDMTNPVHQRACFNYRNLQPLWKRDNHVKSDSMTVAELEFMAALIQAVSPSPTHMVDGPRYLAVSNAMFVAPEDMQAR